MNTISLFRFFAVSPFLLFALSLFLLSSCAPEDFVGQRPDPDAETITVTEAMQPSNLGRTIRVEGEVAAVCQEEGCWMTITDETSTVRVAFKDGDFVVPIALTGHVIVEGTIREEIFDEESAKAVGRSIGFGDETVESMKGDQRLPLLTATGVLIIEE